MRLIIGTLAVYAAIGVVAETGDGTQMGDTNFPAEDGNGSAAGWQNSTDYMWNNGSSMQGNGSSGDMWNNGSSSMQGNGSSGDMWNNGSSSMQGNGSSGNQTWNEQNGSSGEQMWNGSPHNTSQENPDAATTQAPAAPPAPAPTTAAPPAPQENYTDGNASQECMVMISDKCDDTPGMLLHHGDHVIDMAAVQQMKVMGSADCRVSLYIRDCGHDECGHYAELEPGHHSSCEGESPLTTKARYLRVHHKEHHHHHCKVTMFKGCYDEVVHVRDHMWEWMDTDFQMFFVTGDPHCHVRLGHCEEEECPEMKSYGLGLHGDCNSEGWKKDHKYHVKFDRWSCRMELFDSCELDKADRHHTYWGHGRDIDVDFPVRGWRISGQYCNLELKGEQDQNIAEDWLLMHDESKGCVEDSQKATRFEMHHKHPGCHVLLFTDCDMKTQPMFISETHENLIDTYDKNVEAIVVRGGGHCRATLFADHNSDERRLEYLPEGEHHDCYRKRWATKIRRVQAGHVDHHHHCEVRFWSGCFEGESETYMNEDDARPMDPAKWRSVFVAGHPECKATLKRGDDIAELGIGGHWEHCHDDKTWSYNEIKVMVENCYLELYKDCEHDHRHYRNGHHDIPYGPNKVGFKIHGHGCHVQFLDENMEPVHDSYTEDHQCPEWGEKARSFYVWWERPGCKAEMFRDCDFKGHSAVVYEWEEKNLHHEDLVHHVKSMRFTGGEHCRLDLYNDDCAHHDHCKQMASFEEGEYNCGSDLDTYAHLVEYVYARHKHHHGCKATLFRDCFDGESVTFHESHDHVYDMPWMPKSMYVSDSCKITLADCKDDDCDKTMALHGGSHNNCDDHLELQWAKHAKVMNTRFNCWVEIWTEKCFEGHHDARHYSFYHESNGVWFNSDTFKHNGGLKSMKVHGNEGCQAVFFHGSPHDPHTKTKAHVKADSEGHVEFGCNEEFNTSGVESVLVWHPKDRCDMWQWNAWGCSKFVEPMEPMPCHGANYSVAQTCGDCMGRFVGVQGKNCREICEETKGMHCERAGYPTENCEEIHDPGCEHRWESDSAMCKCGGEPEKDANHHKAEDMKKHAEQCLKIYDRYIKCSGEHHEHVRPSLCHHCGCCNSKKCIKIDSALAKEINAVACPAHIMHEMGLAR